MCATIPCLPSRTRVVVLQHPDEARHALNTARLAVLALSNAGLRVAEAFSRDVWETAGRQAFLLFPGPDARMLQPNDPLVAGGVLVVPDATWRKARGMVRSNPDLAALPRVMLPPGLPARYRVRHADTPNALSTLEAVAHALSLVEAPVSFDAMLRSLDTLVRQQIEGMGEARYRLHHALRQGTRARGGTRGGEGGPDQD